MEHRTVDKSFGHCIGKSQLLQDNSEVYKTVHTHSNKHENKLEIGNIFTSKLQHYFIVYRRVLCMQAPSQAGPLFKDNW